MQDYDANEHTATVNRSSRTERAGKEAQRQPVAGNAVMAAFAAAAVQRAETRSQGAGPLDDEIAADINMARGGGAAMDDTTRADMEGHLGVDLSAVRVHHDARADALSRSVQAEAFTTGTDVFFRSGRYQPTSSEGRGLLAHELTHVVQQSTGAFGSESRVSHPDDPHEVEAKAVGDAVAASGPAIDREEFDEEELDS